MWMFHCKTLLFTTPIKTNVTKRKQKLLVGFSLPCTVLGGELGGISAQESAEDVTWGADSFT